MRTIVRSVTVLGLSILLVPAAAGRDIFVNNQMGDDTSSGAQQAATAERTGPVASIQKALRLAQSADRIVLANTGRPYRESITLMASRHSGHRLQPFVLEGSGASLDGSAPVPPAAWTRYGGQVYRFQPARVEYQELLLGERPLARVAASRASAEPAKLQPLQWCLHRGYVYFAAEPGKNPKDYPLACADKPVGITLYRVQHVLIRNLSVQHFQLDGINALNSARLVRLEGVRLRNNGRSGIAVGGASLVGVNACEAGANGLAQLLTLPWSETHLDQSRLLAGDAPAWLDRGGRLYVEGQEVAGKLDPIGPLPDAGAAPRPPKP